MKRLTLAAFGVFVAGLVTSGFGCELITAPDRSLIETGGSAGTTTTGGGGTGGTVTTGGTNSTGGTPTTGGGGTGGTPCTAPEDCPDPGNPCVIRTCEDMLCGTEVVAAGTPAGTQTDGDCKISQCNGFGTLEIANDDGDVPFDNVECTDDVCTAGEPSNPPSALNTECGVGGALYCDGLGNCVDCLAADECGIDDECKTFSCDAGMCNQSNANQGTLLAAQTDGDCKVEQCDGAGNVESVDDNADLPVDATTCTDDLCTAGAPSNPPVPANTGCSEGTGTLCDGAGACVECNLATDCPGVDDECQTRTCTAGVCGFDFTAMGTPVASQIAGNCKKDVCDGAGAVVSSNDDADLPNDNNDCTADSCVAGVPTFDNTPLNSACGLGGALFCDGNGVCKDCTADAQCGVSDECKTFTCGAGGVCNQANTPANTAVASQATGDCKKNVCDGSGNVISANDDADLPADDGNQCTGEVCSNGTPTHPASALNTACSQNGGSFCDGASACVQCNAAAQCAGTDNECQTRTCNGNTCGFNFQANGFQTPTQVPGDCKVRQCDGAGGFVQADANADLPADDGNQCTDEICTAGAPSHPAKAINTACSQNGGSFCDASGACVECNAAAQCSGSDTECQTRTCNANTCGLSFTANGTPVASQTAGDCKENQCNGAGAIVAANKDTDLPADDGNQCTSEVCAAGVASHPNKAVDTACSQNGGSFCSAAGTCVQCNAPAQCAGTDTECQTRTCNSNACGFNFTANGTPVASQTAGDCKENQCNGAGAIVAANKDTDLPADDGNQCTDEVCTAGVASHPNKAVDSTCNQNGGIVCSAGGTCVECNAPAQCPGTDTDCHVRTCASNTCGVNNIAASTPTSTQTPGDCKENQCDGNGGTQVANKDADVPVDGNQCTGDVCTAGVPSNPNLASGDPCSQNGGTVCNGAGSCVAAGCGNGLQDGLETDIDCGGGTCPKCVNGDSCTGNTDCASNICDNGTCVECANASQCPGSDTECQVRTCNSNVCGVSNTAAGFVVVSQTSGNCQRNQCDGNGAITSVADNTDLPADDGNQCTSEVCTAGVPSHPAKAPDTACSQNGGSFCDGSGACVQCNGAAQCPAGDECKTATCNAHACGFSNTAAGFVVASQTSGNCQQNQCDGNGSVTSVADNADLPADDGNQCTNEVCTAGVPSHPAKAVDAACSQNGGSFCDGAGACVQCNGAAQCPAGNECKTATCSANTCGFSNQALGFVVPTQTPNDCQQNQCDGNGNTMSVAFDADLPADDGSQCTDEVCTAGVPSHPAKAIDTPCSQGGGSFCNATGTCVQCNGVAQCPAGDECKSPTCSSNTCGFTFTGAGFVVSSQTSGNCTENQCDGSGNTVAVPQDTDLPADDGNQCTGETCTSGVVGHPALAVGTSCSQSGGTQCNGAGACVLPPSVTATTPANAASPISAHTTIAVTFSKAMNPATLTAQTAGGACSGSMQVSRDDFTTCIGFASAAPTMNGSNTIATLTPQPALAYGAIYKIRVLGTAADAVGLTMGTTFTTATGFTTTTDSAIPLVMSAIYGGGGNSGAQFKNDYIELHNRGSVAVNLTGLSLQYASATGTAWNSGGAGIALLSGTVPPGGYFLVKAGAGAGNGADLVPDLTPSVLLAMSASAGKIALINGTTQIPNGQCPPAATTIDLIGYGNADCREGTAIPTLSNTTAGARLNSGCTDQDNNVADFAVGAPAPRNASTPVVECPMSVNEKNLSFELDFCNVQFPTSLTDITAGALTPVIYAQAYEAGVTDPAGPAAGLTAQIGYGPTTANPENQLGWSWTVATFNVNQGNNDEWQAQLTAPAAGTYRYGARFSLNGVHWTYCDLNGAGSNVGLSFENAQLPTMTTVSP